MMNFKQMTFLLFFVIIIVNNTFAADKFELSNSFLNREISVVGGVLKTSSILNKVASKTIVPTSCEEFSLRLSKDASLPTTDIFLTSSSFRVVNFGGTNSEIIAELINDQYQLEVKVHYTLQPDKFYGHKFLEITSKQFWVLELLDVESISLPGAIQPYQAKDMMWAGNKFLPALGQPLYTSESATFWGVEFPAAWNRIQNSSMKCGYQAAVELEPNQKYTSYKAVFGVGDNGQYIKDAFLSYIDEIRANPFTLKIQYNSWFDFGARITQENFLQSLDKIHSELVDKRACKPLDVYVLDDGWQNSRVPQSILEDWSTGMYKVNETNFDPGLVTVRTEIEKRGSKMGLWASPACIFGATDNINVLETKGFEVLSGTINKSGLVNKSMSMVGSKYNALLEEAFLRMANMGSEFFKFDGIFGNMLFRMFEITPGRGTPVMTQLLPNGIVSNDSRLDDPVFDEMKRYYITRSTEKLIAIYSKMLAINPKIRILNHNGATISPWWLMYTDVISLVNQQDRAQGDTDRHAQMCYRDGIYYQTVVLDNNQIPLNTIFNHEPGKDADRLVDSSSVAFKNYFFGAISRGSAMVELYLQVSALKDSDYDVIADGLKWLYDIYPAFKRSRMHGNNPLGTFRFDEKNVSLKTINMDTDTQVYGFTGWTEDMGYVSIHNPRSTVETYQFTLNRDFGLFPNNVSFKLTSPMPEKITNIKKDWQYGEKFSIVLNPKDVVVLTFKNPTKYAALNTIGKQDYLIYSKNQNIILRNVAGENIRVYSTIGRLISTIDVSDSEFGETAVKVPMAGIYMVKIGNDVMKIIVGNNN